MSTTLRFTYLIALCAVTALTLASCKGDDEPATQIIVSINSDLEIGAELTRVRVEIVAAEGGGRSTPRTFNLTSGQASSGRVRVPFSFGIQQGSAERVTVVVTGFGPMNDGTEGAVIERKESARFRKGETLLLKVFLGAVCFNEQCESDTETCQLDDEHGTAGDCAAVREPDDLDPIEPGDEDDAWDEGAGDDGGAGEGGAGAGGDSGEGGAGAGGDSGEGGAGAGGEGGTGSCDPSCAPGEDCVDGDCLCAGGETTFHRDSDQDGAGDPATTMMACGSIPPSGYVANADDCCDQDERAYPGATTPWNTPITCPDPNLLYDFDCDGSEELGWTLTYAGVCCDLWDDGWVGSVPGCGQPGDFMLCDDVESCLFEPQDNFAQPCL